MRVAGGKDCFGDHKQTPADCLPVDFHTFYGGAFTAFLCRSGIATCTKKYSPSREVPATDS